MSTKAQLQAEIDRLNAENADLRERVKLLEAVVKRLLEGPAQLQPAPVVIPQSIPVPQPIPQPVIPGSAIEDITFPRVTCAGIVDARGITDVTTLRSLS